MYLILTILIGGFLTFYFTLKNVCACEETPYVTIMPTLPSTIPTPTLIPSDTPILPTVSPTLIPTLTAGQSATPTPETQISTPASANNIPNLPPATGRGL